ncbi:hypothetical protein, partial [Bordetella pertussis]|uniref:hypothetical protein n=1 Tax=Bordetella pertussis TaxID=520 RepID=UPI00366B776B
MSPLGGGGRGGGRPPPTNHHPPTPPHPPPPPPPPPPPARASCEDSIGCMHGSSEPDLRNWKSPPPQFTQGARPD